MMYPPPPDRNHDDLNTWNNIDIVNNTEPPHPESYFINVLEEYADMNPFFIYTFGNLKR